MSSRVRQWKSLVTTLAIHRLAEARRLGGRGPAGGSGHPGETHRNTDPGGDGGARMPQASLGWMLKENVDPRYLCHGNQGSCGSSHPVNPQSGCGSSESLPGKAGTSVRPSSRLGLHTSVLYPWEWQGSGELDLCPGHFVVPVALPSCCWMPVDAVVRGKALWRGETWPGRVGCKPGCRRRGRPESRSWQVVRTVRTVTC